MGFEKFYKEKMGKEDFDAQLSKVVREIVEDGLRVMKEICKDTWESAQKEVVSPDTLKDAIALEVGNYMIARPDMWNYLPETLRKKIAKLESIS